MRTTYRLLALLLALMLATPTIVLADPCALCGQESGSDAYLCTACLLNLLEGDEAPQTLKLDTPTINEDGTVTIVWQDTENAGPYSVYYQLLNSAPVPFGWTAAEGVRGHRLTLTQLVPGMSYLIFVKDALGNKAEAVYYAPKPGKDTEIGARIRFKTMSRNEAQRRTFETQWSASKIVEENYLHGLYLRLTYSDLIRTRYYAFCITVEAPNGFADVVFSGTLELERGRSQVPVWGFIPVDNYFSMLNQYYGGVPAGEYKVTMHFNGNVVDTKIFTMAP